MIINLTLHLNVYLFPMILLAIIFISMKKNQAQTMDNRLYRALLQSTFLMLLAELSTWLMDGSELPFAGLVMWATNLIYFLLLPVMSLLWVNYVYFYLYKKTLSYVKPFKMLCMLIPLGVYYGILMTTIFTQWFFSIDRQNHYIRGPHFYLPYILVNIYLVIAFVMAMSFVFAEGSAFRKKQYISLCVVTGIPIAANIIQIVYQNLWLSLPMTAFAELLLYVQMQRNHITTDALTGVNNRGCLNAYLEKKLEQRGENQNLYLFMMDLDHFKEINDIFGHAVGDEALTKAASIICEFFHRTNAFLARYGGDEFCVITHCQDDKAAKALAEQLQKAFCESGKGSSQKYELSLSIGFTQFEGKGKPSQEEIIHRADMMMYMEKKRRKNL